MDKPGFTARLATAVAAALEEWRAGLGDASLAMAGLDLHPWNGSVKLCLLTGAAVEKQPFLLDPAEMASWDHFADCRELAAWASVGALEEAMKAEYSASDDSKETAREYFAAAAAAMKTDAVRAAFEGYSRTGDFRITVAHPDTDEEFYV